MYKSFQDLPVWKNAITLAEDIFLLTRHLPRSEDYGLTSQMRRAANSIHANIAEAFGREYFKDKQRFYTISKGSAYELLNHILYRNKVHYFSKIECESITTKIEILIIQLSKIIKTLRNKAAQEYPTKPKSQPKPQPKKKPAEAGFFLEFNPKDQKIRN